MLRSLNPDILRSKNATGLSLIAQVIIRFDVPCSSISNLKLVAWESTCKAHVSQSRIKDASLRSRDYFFLDEISFLQLFVIIDP